MGDLFQISAAEPSSRCQLLEACIQAILAFAHNPLDARSIKPFDGIKPYHDPPARVRINQPFFSGDYLSTRLGKCLRANNTLNLIDGENLGFLSRKVNVRRAHKQAMASCIVNQRGSRIKAHRLMRQNPRIEMLGVVNLQPGRCVHDVGKRKGMRFGKTKIGKSLNLSKNFLADILRNTALLQPLHERFTKLLHFLDTARRTHGTPELIRLRSAKTCNIHSNMHHLFLEQGNSQGLFQSRTKKWMQIAHFLFPSATTQVGMDGLSLNRARTHQSNLNDNVIKTPGPKPGKHIHLCP